MKEKQSDIPSTTTILYENDLVYQDDLNDYTYELMKGVVGEKNMTFEIKL